MRVRVRRRRGRDRLAIFLRVHACVRMRACQCVSASPSAFASSSSSVRVRQRVCGTAGHNCNFLHTNEPQALSKIVCRHWVQASTRSTLTPYATWSTQRRVASLQHVRTAPNYDPRRTCAGLLHAQLPLVASPPPLATVYRRAVSALQQHHRLRFYI